MAMLPKLKLKALVSFPANVYGGTGIDVSKTNGNFTINLDYSEFPTTGTLPPNTNALVWDPVTDTYYLVPPSSVGGISDAPSDSKMYGRINRAWVDAWASPVLTGNPTAPTPTVGDNDTSIATTAFVASAVSTVTITGGVTYTPQSPTVSQQTIARQNIYAAPFDALAYNGMQINGSFEVSQEQGSAAFAASGNIHDGWLTLWNGTMVITSQQGNSGLSGFSKFLGLSVTTAQASLGAANQATLQHRPEAYRIQRLAFGTPPAIPVTIGFWANHNRIGTYSVSIRNQTATRSCVAAYTQNVTNTWEYKTVTFPGCTDGTWGVDNAIGLVVDFTLACGTAGVAPATGIWYSTNYVAAPGQVNGVTATSDAFRITGIVILPGIEAPSAARSAPIMRPYDQELVTCKRYWRKDRVHGLGPSYAAGSYIGTRLQFSPEMRAAPTTVILTTVSANSVGARSTINLLTTGVTVYATSTAVGTLVEFVDDVAADARL